MARAYSAPQPNEYGQEPADDLRSLRSELVALLDQVESQVSRTRGDDREYRGISERMRTCAANGGRRARQPAPRGASLGKAGGRTLQRPGRLSADARPVRGYPPNPRDTLQSAIQQIARARASLRHWRRGRPAAALSGVPALRRARSGCRRDIGPARAARKRTARRNQDPDGQRQEIAEQVAQLSHVVELLAGAVASRDRSSGWRARSRVLRRLSHRDRRSTCRH